MSEFRVNCLLNVLNLLLVWVLPACPAWYFLWTAPSLSLVPLCWDLDLALWWSEVSAQHNVITLGLQSVQPDEKPLLHKMMKPSGYCRTPRLSENVGSNERFRIGAKYCVTIR